MSRPLTEAPVKRTVIVLLFVVVLLFVTGQLLGKASALRLSAGSADWPTLVLVLAAYGCLVTRGLLWILVLRRLPLSLAYPIISVVYVIVLFASAVTFGETITLTRLLGTILVLCGVALVGLSGLRRDK